MNTDKKYAQRGKERGWGKIGGLGGLRFVINQPDQMTLYRRQKQREQKNRTQ